LYTAPKGHDFDRRSLGAGRSNSPYIVRTYKGYEGLRNALAN
jgi:hypothetical protein